MIIYSLLVLTLLLALLSIAMAFRCGNYRSVQCIPVLLFSVSAAFFVHLYGTWVFISVYAKYLFDLCFVAALVYAWVNGSPRQRKSNVLFATNIVGAAVFLLFSILYYTGTTGKPVGTANLALPFVRGNYFVLQGGKGLPTNLFHYKLRGTIYAMDLVKLNKFGNRAQQVFSDRLSDYEIYGDTLYSPCDGRIRQTNDGNPDNTPPTRKRGPTNTNFILLEADNMYVFMAHLKPGSIFVREGQLVSAGTPIGICGNSGFSIEPHLHIQAHVKTGNGVPWYRGQPLLITFGGQYYRMFDVVKAGGQR